MLHWRGETTTGRARLGSSRGPTFHERESWRKTPLGKAHVRLTSSQTFGSVAILGYFSLARVVHRPKVLRVRGVEEWRGGGFERLRFVVRFLASNGTGPHRSRAVFSVHLSRLLFDLSDRIDVEGSLLQYPGASRAQPAPDDSPISEGRPRLEGRPCPRSSSAKARETSPASKENAAAIK